MTLDYTEIGKRIARRRKELGLKQSEVEEHRTQHFYSFRRGYHASCCGSGYDSG